MILILKNIVRHMISVILYIIPISSIGYVIARGYNRIVTEIPIIYTHHILIVPLIGMLIFDLWVIDLNIQILEHVVSNDSITNPNLCFSCKQYFNLENPSIKDTEFSNLNTHITNLKTYYK